ncbi:MAG TPA: 8-amino-7-oxononanoate synthase, partial [Polyangiaceae bacterium]|nr:8-amino-7-oxononanoate synthase [Polyangiaceae bacterium]
MRPEKRIEQRMEALQAANLWRDPAPRAAPETEPNDGMIDGRSNDYLGFGRAHVSREAFSDFIDLGATASRLISGTGPEHLALETELAGWLGLESALLFSSAYDANFGTLSALGLAQDVIFSDALNHASIIDGCRLSRARVVVTPHRDLGALRRALAEHASGPGALWVVTESYFGMDGTSPNLRGLRALCDFYEAGLIVDEVHALGVFGPEGRGRCAEAGVVPDLLIGGFGKAFALHGGFAAGSELLRSWLWNRARSFVFSTGTSPLLARLTRQRLAELRAAEARRRQLAEASARLSAQLEQAGVTLPPGREGPVFPIIFGGEVAALTAASELRRHGVLAHPIRPPTVPIGTSRLRLNLRADFDDEVVDAIGAALIRTWTQLAAEPPRGALSPGATAALDPESVRLPSEQSAE